MQIDKEVAICAFLQIEDLDLFELEHCQQESVTNHVLREKYSYAYLPSYILSNEAFDIDKLLTGSETWVNLVNDSNASTEIIMEKDWTETDIEGDIKSLKYIRRIFVIDKKVKESFLNMRDHRSVRLSFDS